MKSRTHLVKPSAILFLAATLLLGASPGHALRAVANASLALTPIGWSYRASSHHDFLIRRFGILETFKPVFFQGQLGKFDRIFSIYERCWKFDIVANRYWQCSNAVLTPCPSAYGQWQAATVATAGLTAFSDFTGRLTASCSSNSPPSCFEGAEPAYTFLVDLESGLPVHVSTTKSFEPYPLHRIETVEGKNYIANEWAVIEGGLGLPVTLVEASSTTFGIHGRQETTLLGDFSFASPPRRMLLVQAIEHVGNTRRPLVHFYADQVSLGAQGHAAEPQTVAIRVVYRPDGSLESAQTLDGSADAGELARGLALDFVDETRHRTEVFAVFELGEEIRLLTALPVFMQCCCGLECTPEE